jgi:hypothetical protein
MVILYLLSLVTPNLHSTPAFNPQEIQNMFATLNYPYSIRADAITAVGAPSSVAFLMKAIYWLYLAVRTFYRPRTEIVTNDERQYSPVLQSLKTLLREKKD